MNQGESEHPYQRLLTKFRQSHARHAKSPFVVELFSVKTLGCEREWHPDDFLHIGKFLFTQKESLWVDPVVVCATVGSLPALEDMPPRAFYDLAKQAWAEFEPLANEAGAHLPLAITDKLPDEPDDPLSQWFALLYATHSMRDEDLAEALRDRKILLRSPFKASANVIEKCKLDTNVPILPPIRQAPRKQGDAAGGEDGGVPLPLVANLTEAQAGGNGDSDPPPEQSPQPFTVNENLSQIRIDGKVHEVPPEAARMARLLLEANGEWVAMGRNHFTKPSETKGKLPEAVQNLLETNSGKGYRLKRQPT